MPRHRLRKRLGRVETTAPPRSPKPAEPSPLGDETLPLAAEMARAFGQVVEGYHQHFGLSPEEARQRAADPSEVRQDRILNSPPEQVEWSDLDLLAQQDPALALQRWEQIKEAARQELRTGYRAAQALEVRGSICWIRAQFLALRNELAETWRPRDGMELQLIDQLAQWQTLLWRWQETLTAYTLIGFERQRPDEPPEPPRLSDAEALEEAARMVERIHGLYVRTMRVLQDKRRVRPPVMVRRTGRVRIGEWHMNEVGAGLLES